MPVNDDTSLEKEADVMGAKAAQAKFEPGKDAASSNSNAATDAPALQAKFDKDTVRALRDAADSRWTSSKLEKKKVQELTNKQLTSLWFTPLAM